MILLRICDPLCLKVTILFLNWPTCGGAEAEGGVEDGAEDALGAATAEVAFVGADGAGDVAGVEEGTGVEVEAGVRETGGEVEDVTPAVGTDGCGNEAKFSKTDAIITLWFVPVPSADFTSFCPG